MATLQRGSKNSNLRLLLNPWLLGIVLLAFLMMAWLSLARYYGYSTRGFDLGAMSQSIWSATQGHPLVFTSEGVALSRLARHVELFYFLLAPLYAIFPTPATLLIFQAAFYAVGAFPIYVLSYRRLQHNLVAIAISIIYLFYPVAQTAVLFDFHGDTLAMPLLLLAIDALDRDDGRSYAIWLVLALSCKFYVAVPVAALGVMLWLQGRRRLGWVTAVIGVAWFSLAFGVIRPIFAPPAATHVEATAASYISYYFGRLNLAATGLVRLSNAVIVYGPVLLLAWRAPLWLLPATAVILPVLVSSGPGPSYDYTFHHYALAVPFLMAALIYGAEVLRASGREAVSGGKLRSANPWLARIGFSLLLTLLLNSFLVNTPLNPRFYAPPPGKGLGLDTLSGYAVTPRDAFKDEWLAPLASTDKPLAADRLLALRLVNRETLYLAPPEFRPLPDLLAEVDAVAVDSLFDYALGEPERVFEGGVTSTQATISWLLAAPEWRLSAAQDGLLLFTRGGDGLEQRVELLPSAGERPFLARFDDAIGLVDTAVAPLGNHHYSIRYDWVALRPLSTDPPLIAVSRPEGLEHARIVHLPTLGLMPAPGWPVGPIVREEFEFTLPYDTPPGRYPLFVGWYDAGSLFAAATDARSRMGDEVLIGWLDVR